MSCPILQLGAGQKAQSKVIKCQPLEVQRCMSAPDLDPYLSIRALAAYSGLSIRKLRSLLTDRVHPLPHHRIGRKILVRRSDFDGWIAVYRRRGAVDVDRIVDELTTFRWSLTAYDDVYILTS